jgi:hypothetical protein
MREMQSAGSRRNVPARISRFDEPVKKSSSNAIFPVAIEKGLGHIAPVAASR